MQSFAARAATRALAARPRSILLMAGAARSASSLPLLSSPAPMPLPLRRAAVAARAATTTTTTKITPLPTPTSPPDWTIRMLYDGECALCMKEVDFLRKRDASAGGKSGRVDFVDIASDSYRADQNCGIDYETAMEKIHAIKPDGQVITGIAVFRELYEAVGLGWVYAATASPGVEKAANAVYDFWAKYRTRVTGREDMSEIFEARRRRMAAAGGSGGDLPGSECRVDGSGCGDEATK
jgi:predicted DCC family thiol-disulfide oxidoreductase YuxK